MSVKETLENVTLNVGQRDLGEILISIYVLSIVINTQTTEMRFNYKKMLKPFDALGENIVSRHASEGNEVKIAAMAACGINLMNSPR